MKAKQDLTIKDLCKILNKVLIVEESGKHPVLQSNDGSRKLSNLSPEEQKKLGATQVKFTQDEKDLMLARKEFFASNNYSKTSEFLGTEVSAKPGNIQSLTKEEKFIALLTEFTNEKEFFTAQEVKNSTDKLLKLCGSVDKMIDLIGAHSVKDSKQPIHDLVISFDVPSNQDWNVEKWFKLCMREKNALKLLSRADDIQKSLGDAPSSYAEGMSMLREIRYPRAKEIEEVKNQALSSVMNKERLYRYTELCIEKSVKEKHYNTGLDILLNPNLKAKDNLSDIVIDGNELGEEFKKYYMAKLPAGDPRGLLLGELTNCCQSIGSDAAKAVIDGMMNENSGFYAIFEKGRSGKQDIDNDRIIAQSYTWLGLNGAKGKSLVFDSWERLGKDNNKLLDPFYSKFADIAKDQFITKITIGQGGNTPNLDYIPFTTDLEPTKFNGKAPYGDAYRQYIILDQNHEDISKNIAPYDKATEQRRNGFKLLKAMYEDQYESHEENINIVLDKYWDNISNEIKDKMFHYAEGKGYKKIVTFLLDKCGTDISNEDKARALIHAKDSEDKKIAEVLFNTYGSEVTDQDKERALKIEECQIYKNITKYMIQSSGKDLSASYIKNAFKNENVINDLYMYRTLVRHVPEFIINSIKYDDADIQKGFVSKITKSIAENAIESSKASYPNYDNQQVMINTNDLQTRWR